MKKLVLLIVAVFTLSIAAWGQNANRSGIFIEAGAGVLAGRTPTYKIEIDHGIVKGYNVGGAGLNLALGYRYATSRSCAVELKVEGSASPKAIVPTLVLGIMPGFRYTTRELFSNISLFFGVNAGFAAGYETHMPYLRIGHNMYDNAAYDIGHYGIGSIGGCYGLTLGMNITSSLYAGLFWDGYILNDKHRGIEKGMLHWGTAGLRLGFRF